MTLSRPNRFEIGMQNLFKFKNEKIAFCTIQRLWIEGRCTVTFLGKKGRSPEVGFFAVFFPDDNYQHLLE